MPLGSKKSIENACSSDLEATWSVETARRSDCRGDLERSWLARGGPSGKSGRAGRRPGPKPLRVIRIGMYYILYDMFRFIKNPDAELYTSSIYYSSAMYSITSAIY